MKGARQKYYFEWFEDFTQMFFPKVCAGCGEALVKRENLICLNCLTELPRTNLHRIPNNFIKRKFTGRLPVHQVSSFLIFTPRGVVQRLIHLLKYEGRQDVGERLGQLYAMDLAQDGYDIPDVIIPLPLHPAKRRRRGYNQCEPIADGLNKHFNADIQIGNVVRTTDSASQTRKGRWDRWLNVERIFRVRQPERIRHRHVLLVDDVVTTGATLEACGRTILDAGATKLSMLTLATA